MKSPDRLSIHLKYQNGQHDLKSKRVTPTKPNDIDFLPPRYGTASTDYLLVQHLHDGGTKNNSAVI